MAKDVIARLKADTSQWDSGLSKASKSLNKFRQENMSLDGAIQGSVKSLTSAAAKYVGWGAAVAGAMKVAKDAFMNNEAALDEWGRTVESTEGLYKGFLNSLNTGDISGYLSNMSDIISAARDAYDAMDELATFKAFNQVNSARNKAGYSEALDAYRLNPNDQTKKALADANDAVIKDLKDEASMSNKEYNAALKNLFTQRGLSKEAQEQARKLFSNGSWSDINKAKNAGYQELGWGESMGKGYLGTMDTWKGQRVAQSGDYVALYKNNGNVVDRTLQGQEKVDYELSRFLQGVNDTEIKAVQELGAKSFALEQAIADQNRSYNRMAGNNARLITRTTSASTTSQPASTAPDYKKGSVKDLAKQIQELQEKQANIATSSEVWTEYQVRIDALVERVKALKGELQAVGTITHEANTQGLSIDSIAGLSAIRSNATQAMNNATIGSDRYEMAVDLIADTNTMETLLPYMERYVPEAAEAFKEQWGMSMAEGLNIPDEAWEHLIELINEKLTELNLQPINIDLKTGNIEQTKMQINEVGKSAKAAGAAFSAMGSALGQIEDPGAKVAGYIAAAIGQTAAAFGTAQVQAAELGPWAWIAFAATGLGVMLSTIAGIKSATSGYADGGEIRSNSYVGDSTPIMANAGEIVLNASQTQNVASSIASNASQSNSSGYVRAEDIYLGMNNWGRRTGRGELVFSK